MTLLQYHGYQSISLNIQSIMYEQELDAAHLTHYTYFWHIQWFGRKIPELEETKVDKVLHFRKKGSLGLCIWVLPKESSLLYRWTCHLLPHKESHQNPWVWCAPLKVRVLHWCQWKSCSAMSTQHQHKGNHCSAMRADFCHQCFNQVTSEDICLMALAVS